MTKEKTQGSTEAESKQIAIVEEQIFKDLTYKFESVELTLGLTLRTLLDSGSPISFIKESFIPAKLVTRVSDETSKYTGLNKSPLEIREVTQATVEFEGEILSGLLLRVVPDSSIKASVIIGRDTWKILGLTVNRKRDTSAKREIEDTSVKREEDTSAKRDVEDTSAIRDA